MDKIAILIPCYNEGQTIKKVIADWKREIPDAVIYVYDNNSTDRTSEYAAESGAIVRREYQQGKGNVIRRMFREIDAQVYIMVDGDDTYPAEYGRNMVDCIIKEGADMVIGDRLSSTYFTENKRPFHNFGNSFVRKLINLLFGSDIKDIMTGYRAFSYNFVKTFPVLSQGFEIETEMSIHAIDKNLRMKNIIIEYRDRPEGSSSKLNTYSDGIKVLKLIVKLYRVYKPWNFYSILAVALAFVSTCFFIPVFLDYLKTGQVLQFPTLIVCGFVYMAAIISFFAGGILSSIVQKNRQDFEMNFIRCNETFIEKVNKTDGSETA